MISPSERRTLGAVVRQQFKVLRAEIAQRQAEVQAEAEAQITERFAAEDQQWTVVSHEVHEAVMECNRRINDSLRDHGFASHGLTERLWVYEPTMRQPSQKRTDLRRQAEASLTAQVQAARLRLERQEADLLRSLAVGAIESDEARAFLEGIPTVGELVPGARLAELEASLSGEGPQ